MRYGVRCGHERSAIRSNGWLQAARAAPFLSGRQGRPARCVRRLALIWRCLVDSRVKEERRFLMSTEVRGALHFDCAHGSSTSFLWRVETGKEGVMRGFWKERSRFLRFAPALSVSATFSGEPALAHQGPPNPAFAARNAPARKGALAVGERMAQLYGLTCARPGRARRTAEWAFTLKDRISTNVSRETSIAHLCCGFVFLHRASLSVIAGPLAFRRRLVRTFPVRWRQEGARGRGRRREAAGEALPIAISM